MTVASALLQRHIETLLRPGEWEALIADDILWELPFAPALGHPGRLEGREAVETHVKWFRGAVENFRFSEIRVYPLADPDGAVGEVRAEGRIRATGGGDRRLHVLSRRVDVAVEVELNDDRRGAERAG